MNTAPKRKPAHTSLGKCAPTKFRVRATKTPSARNGYRKLGVTQKRTIQNTPGVFHVEDQIFGNKENLTAEGHLHFHPDVRLKIDDNSIIINEDLYLHISGATEIKLDEYQYAGAFNKLRPAKKINYQFSNKSGLFFREANKNTSNEVPCLASMPFA